jgi:hypothetical protein
VQFYESLFSEQCNWRPRLDNLAFDMLEVGEADWLEAPFEEREVMEVVKGMDKIRLTVWMASLRLSSKIVGK